jgi:hypothetical protein
MRDFLNNLSSTYWWISVVIVGVIINIVSAYLVRKLDPRLSLLSSWWRKRSEAKRDKRKVEIEKLRGNSHEQILIALSEIRQRIRAVVYVLWGIVFLGLGTLYDRVSLYNPIARIIQTIFLLLGGLAISIAVIIEQQASNKKDLLEEANQDEESTSNP